MPLDIVLPIAIKRVEKSPEPALDTAEGAHAAGYNAGYEEGKLRAEWEARREAQKQAQRVQALAHTLETLHKEYEALVGEHLPDLIHGALQRVFRQHPFTAEEVASEVAALLRDLEQAGRLTLECAPGEAEELQQRLADCGAIPNDSNWTLQPSASLKPGEFLLKSDLGDVDGRHSSRIRQIHHALEK
ncbi:MAG TPA: FliH/SctL family protein [Candidatus Methylacidiphilales bacterium]|jgi:flagellar biosynthesis/type III secretory pathway protein FliH|nr:FliH/SctL family protein [Candidatus Methylacidiphilales bacterium]